MSKNDIQKSAFDISDEKIWFFRFYRFSWSTKGECKVSIEKLNNYGIRVIVLTGDNAEVTKCVCNKVNINSKRIILGSDIDKLSDLAVIRILKK